MNRKSAPKHVLKGHDIKIQREDRHPQITEIPEENELADDFILEIQTLEL